MRTLILIFTFVTTLAAQVTSIPAASGPGTITAGRVAFGDGTSTAATDSQFLFNTTTKGLQVGSLIAPLVGYEDYIAVSGMKSDNTIYNSYQDVYGGAFVRVQGNGTSGADVYGSYSEGRGEGTLDSTAESGDITGIYSLGKTQGSAQVNRVLGFQTDATMFGTSSANRLVAGRFGALGLSNSSVTRIYGIDIFASSSSSSPPTYIYGLNIQATTTASQNWNIYSAAGTGNQARNYLGGNTGIGVGSDSPTNTLYVKNGTASTGATTVVFDIGAGQSSTSTILTLGGVIRFNGQNTTGAGSAALGSNSPATTNTAPYTWIRAVSSDGSTVYIPAWK